MATYADFNGRLLNLDKVTSVQLVRDENGETLRLSGPLLKLEFKGPAAPDIYKQIQELVQPKQMRLPAGFEFTNALKGDLLPKTT